MGANKQHLIAQMLLRAWPFPRGAGRLIDLFFSNLTFDKEKVTVRTTDAFEMQVMPNDHIGRHIYLTGEFDRSTVEVLCNFAVDADTLLDVGANVGYVSACFLNNVRDSKVIAVEPQPTILDLLSHNLKQFASDRYQIAPVALSDHSGEAWFEICERNRGASKLVKDASTHTTRVPVWSADRLLSSLDIRKLDLVKFDVEGHEERLFNSCRDMFRQLQPRAILFEERTKQSAPDGSIGALLQASGYRVFGIRKLLTTIRLVPVSSGRDCVYNDYIAICHGREIPQRAAQIYGIT
jgi:FkbM family methyltransferase